MRRARGKCREKGKRGKRLHTLMDVAWPWRGVKVSREDRFACVRDKSEVPVPGVAGDDPRDRNSGSKMSPTMYGTGNVSCVVLKSL